MKEFKVFTKRNQSTYLCLLIFDLNNKLRDDGVKVANNLVSPTFCGMHSIILNDFLDNIEYVLEEMWFVKRIAEMLGLEIDNDISEKLQNLWNAEGMHAVVKLWVRAN